jgi:hypothetical protein
VGPTNRRLIWLFVHEIEVQCRWALAAIADMQANLQQHSTEGVFFFMHAFLTHAGNVSKIMWPSAKYRDRGSEIRTELGIRSDLLIADRKFRNHLEHFDERLHAWATESEHHNFMDMGVVTKGGVVGLDTGDYIRIYDPNDGEHRFRGDTFDLPVAVREIQDTLAAAQRWLTEHPWASP